MRLTIRPIRACFGVFTIDIVRDCSTFARFATAEQLTAAVAIERSRIDRSRLVEAIPACARPVGVRIVDHETLLADRVDEIDLRSDQIRRRVAIHAHGSSLELEMLVSFKFLVVEVELIAET